ncbi:MAG: glycosyltransferase family 4 protein [Cyclobacteriaceae bacterium]|nr:glycosyltransferase family 4 protein [Cyclobacteriaceae bacterium]
MEIVHIVPGSGGSFYCGNCLRDSTYIQSMKKAGLGVTKIPMYLPIFSDEHDLGEVPVFYGAISLYLKHTFPLLRKAPGWVDRILNSGPALKMAASMAGSTNPKGLEDMSISMLLGEQGEQKKELDHLVTWIAENCNPDVIHLSNALLMGLARRIREKLDVLVVCSLQDEDTWVNAMDENYRIKTWKLMRERARDIDAFVAVSDFYAARMKDQLDIPDERLITQHISLNPGDYHYINSRSKERVVGFISRMSRDNGLEILVDAFILLKKEDDMKDTRLMITGGNTGVDEKYIRKIKDKIKTAGLKDEVIFHEDFEGTGRHDFFSKVSLLSVPVLEGEAFGLYLIEAMASGIPVVQPALGAFPEIVEKSEGGVVYSPNVPERLAFTLSGLLRDPQRLEILSRQGRNGVEKHFNILTQANRMIKIYKDLLGGQNR